MEQCKDLVNWLTDNKLNGNCGTNKPEDRDNDEVGLISPVPKTGLKDPSTNTIREFKDRKLEKSDEIPDIWALAPESKIHDVDD